MHVNRKTSEVNLWEALTDATVRHRSLQMEEDAQHLDKVRQGLNLTACLAHQEITIKPHVQDKRNGWLIRVISPEETGKVEIFIPQHRDKAVEILTDTRPYSQWHRDEPIYGGQE